MNDPTIKKNPWMYLGVIVLALFLGWRVLALIADRISYYTDPAYKARVQRQSEVLTQHIPIRETALTAVILAVCLIAILAAVAWLYIYLRSQWERRALVQPTQHGYPAHYANGVLTVPAQPTALLPAPGSSQLLPDRVLIFDAPLPRDGTLPIGVRPDGRQITLPLMGAGGGLVAGNPGMGKSELLGSIIIAAHRLYQESIAPVEIILVDPKRLDFVGLPRLANMPYSVVSDYAETMEVLKELAADMEHRKRTLQNAKARSIDHYLSMGGQMTIRWLLVDEVSSFVDQVSKAQREAFIKLISEFNRIGRAHGYTVLLASQRLHSSDVPRAVTGIVEWRAAFHVSTDVESRMALTVNGAENLPGPGRFLLKDGSGLMPGQAYLADLKGRYGPGFYGYLERARLAVPPRVVTIDAPAHTVYTPSTQLSTNPSTNGSTHPPSAENPIGVAGAHTNRLSVDSDSDTTAARDPDAFDAETFPATEQQQRYLFGKYQELGNVTAVSQEVYDARGGIKWQWTRWAVGTELQRRGLDVDPTWLNLPPSQRRKQLGASV